MKKFYGIAPRYETRLSEGYAVTAENCDLTGGILKPLKGHALEYGATGADIIKFDGNWEIGKKDYIRWPINNYNLLFYLEGTTLKKKIDITTVGTGQTIPNQPTVSEGATGNLTGTYQYIVTWKRSVGGYIDESGPSTPSSEITVSGKKITVNRPTGYTGNVTEWNIYRISRETGEFQFVAGVAISTATYTDNTIDADLSASPTTWYTSDQGNEITFAPPPELEGLSGPHGGMLFGWYGSTLYWSEPAYPDAWPVFYQMNFPYEIKAVMPFAGALSVLTQGGAFRVDGNHPELLQQTEALSSEPCLNTDIARSSRGVFYMSDSGLVLFNGFESVVVSDQAFTETWFRQNINISGVILAENDNIIYIFHDAGTLYMDMQTKQWATMPGIYRAAWKEPETGWLYAADAAGIWKINGSVDDVMVWKSGDITASIKDVPWKEIEVVGTGEIILTVWIDGSEKAVKSLEFGTLYRERTLGLLQEYQGRRLQLQFEGTGTIEEVIPRV